MKFLYQRLLIKSAFIYLFLGGLVGFGMFLGKRFEFLSVLSYYRVAHFHMIFIGTLIQLIMGVALWMFPRKAEPPHYTEDREGMPLFIVLNMGVILRSLFEPWAWSRPLYYILAGTGMFLEICAIAYFLVLVFPRIRGPKYH